MSRRLRLSLLVAALALAGTASYETFVALENTARVQAVRTENARLAAQTATLRRDHDNLARDLTAAERQLASLPSLPATSTTLTTARRTEMQAWLARVKQLRRLFDEHPEQRIPEMRYLTDQDWLRVAKNLKFDSIEDSRPAFAAIRDAASENFRPHLSQALRAFAKNPPTEPTSALALQSFSESQIDTALLERYELLKTTASPPRWRVQTKAPLDADYDTRFYIEVYVDNRGSMTGSESAPYAWIPNFRERNTRAYQAYSQANQGLSPNGLADVLPYFSPPLDSALADKLLKAERDRKP